MFPGFAVNQTSPIGKIVTTNEWWAQPHLCLSAFRQLTQLKLDRSPPNPYWTCQPTLPRSKKEEPIGSALIHTSTTVHPGTHFVGDVLVCEGCEIGPNCSIFGPTIIGPKSYVGPGAEIRRSLIFSRLTLAHVSYLGHSVVGRRVNLGAGFITAVRNYKRGTVHLKSDGILFDTGFTMFGAIIADDFLCRINTSVMPGRLLNEPLI